MIGSSINCSFLKIEKKRERKSWLSLPGRFLLNLVPRALREKPWGRGWLSPVSHVTPWSGRITHQINQIITRGPPFAGVQDPEALCGLNPLAKKYTRCCHSNSGHLSQMNETNLAWWIFRQIYQVRYLYNVFKHINAYRKWSIKRRGAYLISLL